ncbi:MAG: hypothetical protein M1823_001723 [Watsoniomyces obsoletus]|nr:MAG: hypothetical protein M1823_001723 [Watsoniomyces obsoletus]
MASNGEKRSTVWFSEDEEINRHPKRKLDDTHDTHDTHDTSLMPRPKCIRTPLAGNDDLALPNDRRLHDDRVNEWCVEHAQSHPNLVYQTKLGLGPRNTAQLAFHRETSKVVIIKACSTQDFGRARQDLIISQHEHLVGMVALHHDKDIVYIIQEFMDVTLSQVIGGLETLDDHQVQYVCCAVS